MILNIEPGNASSLSKLICIKGFDFVLGKSGAERGIEYSPVKINPYRVTVLSLVDFDLRGFLSAFLFPLTNAISSMEQHPGGQP